MMLLLDVEFLHTYSVVFCKLSNFLRCCACLVCEIENEKYVNVNKMDLELLMMIIILVVDQTLL